MIRRQRIRESVETLLKKYGVKATPVEVDDIARGEGAIIRCVPLGDDVSGFLYQENDKVIIGVNSSHPKERQRFTVAHELGHLLLKHSDPVHVDRATGAVKFRDRVSETGREDDEVEANAFAAELLMPSGLLVRHLRGSADTANPDDFVENLAKDFKVSVQAMTIRLGNLGRLWY